MAYGTSVLMTHGYPRQIVSQLSSATGLVISSATIAQNLDTSQGTSRHQLPRQRHQQLKYLAAETLATEVLAAETLATEVLAAETLATEVLAAETLATEVLTAETLATEVLATEVLAARDTGN